VGEDVNDKFKSLFGMPIIEAASTGLLLSAKEIMKFYQLNARELSEALLQYGCESCLLETGFHVCKLTGLPGRKSDVLVINGFLPILQEQFEVCVHRCLGAHRLTFLRRQITHEPDTYASFLKYRRHRLNVFCLFDNQILNV
jgi:hypothetical protein